MTIPVFEAKGWTDAKVRRFISAWDDEVLLSDLRARFEIQSPKGLATRLRQLGYQLAHRSHHAYETYPDE